MHASRQERPNTAFDLMYTAMHACMHAVASYAQGPPVTLDQASLTKRMFHSS